MTHEISLKTRYSETAQDGIIHHSSYVIYYETARIEYLTSKGYNINEMENRSILCPVVSMQAYYLKPLRSLEEIEVRVSVHSYSKVRFEILHEIFKDGQKMAYAISSHCFINANFKPLPIPNELLDSFRQEIKK